MNKFLTFVLLVITSSLSFAQDLIITKDKEQIQAKILEVSEDEVRYKKILYQDGPIFKLDIDDILTIAYENGDVEVYDEELIQEKEEAIHKKTAMYGTFVKEDDFYYLCYGAKTTKMDQKSYLQFIKNNCPEAYKQWLDGYTLWNAGWGALGAGLTFGLLVGTPLYVVGRTQQNEVCTGLGSIFTAVGALTTAGSIPMFIVGGIKKNNSYEKYNDRCRQFEEVSLVLNAKSNGLGLAINF